MKHLYIRLDDACEKMDIDKWSLIEKLLDKYSVKPIVGIIPHCEDPMMDKYPFDCAFWEKVQIWMDKGWTIALHGYNHVYSTCCGGINPVNKRSEFAGESLDIQKEKIRKGVSVFRNHGIDPVVFFAPSHTFDEFTLTALREESNIEIISDTIAWDSYKYRDFVFIPQQSGRVRKLPFKTTTYCYHPNSMDIDDYKKLEIFLKSHRISDLSQVGFYNFNRKKTLFDRLLSMLYFLCKKI